MTYRSECTCFCHQPGVKALHCVPCCVPDPPSESLVQRLTYERDLLAEAIADAAKKAGIYNGEVPLTGPHLLMLADDLAEVILSMESNLDIKAEFIDKTLNDLADKEFGKDETMYRALEAIVARSYNDPLGTSKVIDMRKIAERAMKEVGE